MDKTLEMVVDHVFKNMIYNHVCGSWMILKRRILWIRIKPMIFEIHSSPFSLTDCGIKSSESVESEERIIKILKNNDCLVRRRRDLEHEDFERQNGLNAKKREGFE